jgi:hypothetical protein
MELQLRAALIDWLAGDATLSGMLNAVTEETPQFTSLPWLGIAKSSSVDWSTKTEIGYEIKVELLIHMRGDALADAAAVVAAVHARMLAYPRNAGGMQVVSLHKLQEQAKQTSESTRTYAVEYRFRVIAG